MRNPVQQGWFELKMFEIGLPTIVSHGTLLTLEVLHDATSMGWFYASKLNEMLGIGLPRIVSNGALLKLGIFTRCASMGFYATYLNEQNCGSVLLRQVPSIDYVDKSWVPSCDHGFLATQYAIISYHGFSIILDKLVGEGTYRSYRLDQQFPGTTRRDQSNA